MIFLMEPAYENVTVHSVTSNMKTDILIQEEIMKKEEIDQIQTTLLGVLPYWNYRIAKPFKQRLDEGVSMEMYYFLQTLRYFGGTMALSELMPFVGMQKQQMTKITNRLAELGFIRRVYDSADRRIIKIQITDKALDYIDHFLMEDMGCYRRLLETMDEKDRQDFKTAVDILMRVLPKIPCEWEKEGK